ncbi:MAG: hypothetical protein WDA75_03885 [Candidatus Latescibacterota bacterium]|jgi:ABC-type nickel/cobalt efflux system permease component RcnA
MMRLLPGLLLLSWLAARSAGAHQITGTDVATLTQLIVDHNRISGYYEVQYGELSALEERRRMDGDGDGRITEAETVAYAAARAGELAAHLSLTLDDGRFAVRLEQGEVLPVEPLVAPGQMTLRYRLADLRADLTREASLSFRDDNRLPRLVHADISVEAMPLVDLGGVEPRAGALKLAKVQAPRGPVEARVPLRPAAELWQGTGFAAGQEALGPVAGASATTASSTTDRLKGMLRTEQLGLGVIVFALTLALFLGAIHALEPGHGKTIVAAYLIGARGTVANAVFLGGVVTFTHTFSVILLGALTLLASQYVLPERIFPWLGAGSGLLICGLGIWMLARRSRGHDHDHGKGLFAHSHGPMEEEHQAPEGHGHAQLHDHGHHEHEHDHHDHEHHEHEHQDHEHPHPHEHDHPHDHVHVHDQGVPHSSVAPRDHPHPHPHPREKVTVGSLLALGISGGIVPCPGALVILLLAVALHRIAFGLLLILTFSLGLAAVLIAIGILMVKARPVVERFSGSGPVVRRLPLVSALVITAVGLVMAVRSLMEAGILIVRL